MAEIKNSFLKSKMNKDLDDRLIPNGEYRDARNISVGKSEDDDIGALENVKGNTLVPGTNIGTLQVIGYLTSNNSETIYLFLTNNSTASPGTTHYIYKYFNSSYTKILEGAFLNFSADNYITGVNLVEDLLFWTDNRNQPRKINVNKPLGYYFKENQISVAKYNPYEPIELLKTITATGTSTGVNLVLTTANTLIKKGMSVIVKNNSNVQKVDADKYIYVTNVSGTAVTLNVQPTDEAGNNYNIANTDTITFLVTTMTGKDITYDFNSGVDWPGDPDFLQDLFVRFSYRFKFDDQEYSLMAPFTQPTFIPQQKGYFLEGDEDAAYRSTILDFMQNGVQNVELIIPLPDKQSKLGDGTLDTYKIVQLDILYKESDARAVKVLDTINVDDLSSSSNIYLYNYQSRKPYKTLPERQTVRVYDRVPVRALAQEVSGNRVMYGNFQSQHTPPAKLDYSVGASAKNTTVFTNWAEYPNHTLKKNRNYQVGFILSDKFGRQSSVILSTNDDVTTQTVGNTVFGGSTFYHPYTSATQNLKQWFGDALKVVINSEITSSVNRDGEGAPGLYADQIANGFNITGTPVITDTQYTFILAGGAATTGLPVVNSYLRGENTDFVKVTERTGAGTSQDPYIVTTEGRVNDFLYSVNPLNTPDTKYVYTLPNPLGWYSYKIVVKQQEQDYYNCYLPGFLNGYPSTAGVSNPPVFPTTENNKTAHAVLLNDNINKIPRDLNETSDQQKQFRSSVRLYGRVNNTATDNVQYFPVSTGTQTLPLAMTADTISTAFDLSMYSDDISTTNVPFYQLETNPFIARLATSNAGTTIVGLPNSSMTIQLSVAETEPVESLLQLFYETTTVGLIADLNADINTGFDGVAGLSAVGYSHFENMAANSDISAVFRPQNNQGSDFLNTQIENVSMTVTDGNGLTRATGNLADGFTGDFKLVTSGTGYKIQTAVNTFVFSNAGFDSNKNSKEIYNFNFTWTTVPASGGDTSSTPFTGSLTNNDPIFTDWTSGPSLPPVTVSVGDNTGVTRGADNGSATNNTSQIKYSIVSQSPGSYFSIADSSVGVVTKSTTTPLGVYTLNLKAEDAVVGGVVQNGSLSVTKQQVITVGAIQMNTSSKSGCESSIVPGQGIPPMFGAVVPLSATQSQPQRAIWYIANGTFTSSSPASGYALTDLPVQPSTSTGDSNFLFRLGTPNNAALSAGTVVFSCNMQQKYSSGSSAPRSGSKVQWKVYHRDNASDATWSQLADVNNSNVIADAELINNSSNTTKYASTAFAFDTVGEYLVVAENAYHTYAGTFADSLVLWVNSDDLYYGSCVVENGSQITAPYSNPTAWHYEISSHKTAYGCYATSTNRYAPMAYAEYVDIFYLNSTLSSPANGSTYSYPNFFGFDAAFGKPFDQIKVSAKFDAGGIKISGDANTCSDKLARPCSSTPLPVCSRPVPGAIGWL
jgi:hypothetical protein